MIFPLFQHKKSKKVTCSLKQWNGKAENFWSWYYVDRGLKPRKKIVSKWFRIVTSFNSDHQNKKLFFRKFNGSYSFISIGRTTNPCCWKKNLKVIVTRRPATQEHANCNASCAKICVMLASKNRPYKIGNAKEVVAYGCIERNPLFQHKKSKKVTCSLK